MARSRRSRRREAGRRSPRFALIAATLAGLLILATGVLLALAFRDTPKGVAGSVLASAIGGPFRLVDQNGKPFTEAESAGQMASRVLWLHALPGHLPDDAQRTGAGARQARREKATQVDIVFISVDPERDTPDAPQILCRQLRRADRGADRQPRRGQAGGQGVPRLLRQAPPRPTAATTWTTAPSSTSWTRKAVYRDLDPRQPRPTRWPSAWRSCCRTSQAGNRAAGALRFTRPSRRHGSQRTQHIGGSPRASRTQARWPLSPTRSRAGAPLRSSRIRTPARPP